MIEALRRLVTRVPGRVWLALGGLLVAAFWIQQHDARIRQQAKLQQLRNQTSAEVAALRKQAAQDVRQANVENAKAIEKLEARRQQVEQQKRRLAAQLARLRKQAQVQAGEVAALPISEIVTRVAAQLGLKAEDVAAKEKASLREGAKAQSKLRGENGDRTADIAGDATTAPAEAKETPHPAAGVSTLSPRRGPSQGSFADIAKSATSAPADAATTDVALSLTSSGARKVETALVDLNACHAESNVQSQRISNCQARAAADEATIQRLDSSVASLNQAIEAKDKILDRQTSECKAELRAARGTFLGRLAHVTEHVVIGLAVGVAIGVAVQ